VLKALADYVRALRWLVPALAVAAVLEVWLGWGGPRRGSAPDLRRRMRLISVVAPCAPRSRMPRCVRCGAQSRL